MLSSPAEPQFRFLYRLPFEHHQFKLDQVLTFLKSLATVASGCPKANSLPSSHVASPILSPSTPSPRPTIITHCHAINFLAKTKIEQEIMKHTSLCLCRRLQLLKNKNFPFLSLENGRESEIERFLRRFEFGKRVELKRERLTKRFKRNGRKESAK